MLNVMRENLRHLKWILVVVAISLTLYLGAFFSGDTRQAAGNWAARVGDEEVSIQAFLWQAEQIDLNYRQLLGDQYEQLKPSLALGSRSIETLIVDEMIRQEAERLGFSASEEEIREAIVNDPSLKDENGNFIGGDRLKQYLQRRYPGGATAFESDLANRIARAKWESMVTESVFVSDAELEEVYRQRNEKAAIRYVVVSSAEQTTPTAIVDTEIAAWYDAHQDDFLRPAGREIAYVVVERQKIAEGLEILDSEIQGFYEQNAARYTRPEQRRARHILLRVEPDATDEERDAIRRHAETVRAQVVGGADFDTLARSTSQDPGSASRGGDLGFFGRGQMVPAFDAASFDTPVGEIAPLTESEFGFHIIEVTDAREAGVTPLEEVRDAISQELVQQRAQGLLQTEADRIRDTIGSVEDLRSVAEAEGLEVEERVVSEDTRLADLGPSPDFRTEIDAMDVGAVSRPLAVARGLAVVVVVAEVPESIAPLEEVEAEIRTAILSHRARTAAADAALAALESGGSFDAAAAAMDREPQESGDLAPGRIVLTGSGGDAPELRAALFRDDVQEGDTGVVRVPAGAVLYEVTRRVPFDREAFAAGRETLETEVLGTKKINLLQETLTNIRERYEIQVNGELIERYNG
jgi:peptidyl-prolyl cis-trans isomerase D